jgi:hypothetical protein
MNDFDRAKKATKTLRTFKKRFDRDPATFASTEEVDKYYSEKNGGKQLKAELYRPDLHPLRGNMHSVSTVNLDETLDSISR